MAVVTLLTDFGWDDYYVAAVKGVLLSLAPEARTVDLAHGVPPGDVESGAFLLEAASRFFPPATVHLAVVDPGVGGERRILAAAARGALFVAPDNGLLTPVLDGASVRSVERRDLFLDHPGATFHGRDRFAPVAAALARGVPLPDLGAAIGDPVRLELPAPRREAAQLTGRVVHVDRFGNLVTNIPSGWLPDRPFSLRLGDLTVSRLVSHYGLLEPGEAGLLPGSLGTLELSLRGASLAARCGAGRGGAIRIQIL